jgi:hypothetical protein
VPPEPCDHTGHQSHVTVRATRAMLPYGPPEPCYHMDHQSHVIIRAIIAMLPYRPHCTIQTQHYYRGHPRYCTITRCHTVHHIVEAGQNCCVSNMQWRLRNRGEKMLCQLFVVLCQLLHNRGGYCARGVRNCCVSNQEYRGLHGVKGVHMADGKIPRNEHTVCHKVSNTTGPPW